MKIKENIKWAFPFIIPAVISLMGKYNIDFLIAVSSIFLFLGVVLMFNPTWIVKPSVTELHFFKMNLKQKFKGYENDIDEIRQQLLRDFRISYIGYSLLGCVFLGFLYYCILLSIDSKFSYGSIIGLTILFLLFFLFESNSLLRTPFSREERFVSSYYCNLLINKDFVDSIVNESSDEIKMDSAQFANYWLKEDFTIHILIELINENSDDKLLFEKKDNLWLLKKGYKSNACQLNFAGFIKALIQLGYLKSSITSTKEDSMSLNNVFYFESQSEDKQFQRLYGQLYKGIPEQYVNYCIEVLSRLENNTEL